MRFTLAVLAPGIKRVVHHHAVPEHLVIISEVLQQAKRERIQTRRLRREVKPGGAGPAHGDGKLPKAGSSSAYLARKASKLHSFPTSLSSTPGMS